MMPDTKSDGMNFVDLENPEEDIIGAANDTDRLFISGDDDNDDFDGDDVDNRAQGPMGNEQSASYRGCPCKHPFVAFFHIFFKAASVVVYLLLWIATRNFVVNFVICVLLLAFDFWTVKNISGRIMVGLRWWNEVHEDGTNVWKFESRENRQSTVAPVDSMVFWGALFGFPLLWLFLTFTAIFFGNFEWLLIVVVALVLGLTNVFGYVRCLKDAKTTVYSALARGYIGYVTSSGSGESSGSSARNAISSAVSSFTSNMMGSGQT